MYKVIDNMFGGNEISVICATLPGINPGMQSVNLAFKLLSEKYRFSHNVVFYKIFDDGFLNETNSFGLKFEKLPENMNFLKKKKKIIFWGDFLHMHHYQSAIAQKLINLKQYEDYSKSIKRVQEVFLLENQDTDILKKTYSFGTTLLFNSIESELDNNYTQSLLRLINYCNRFWVRDIYSAMKVGHLMNDYQKNFLGVDCALLIDPEIIKLKFNNNNQNKKIGVFIGRTKDNIDNIWCFSKSISDKLCLELEWINWGDKNAFPTLNHVIEYASFQIDTNGTSNVIDALTNLLNYSLIITDTYHVSVNSLNLGIPTICFYGVDSYKERDVNYGNILSKIDKREVFYRMYDAQDFLISFEELQKEEMFEKRINHFLECYHSSKKIKEITKKIRNNSKAIENLLIKHLA